MWTVPKSLNPCCVWIQKIIVLKTSLIKAKKEKILCTSINYTITTQRVIIINRNNYRTLEIN